jgi:hypothetical protein
MKLGAFATVGFNSSGRSKSRRRLSRASLIFAVALFALPAFSQHSGGGTTSIPAINTQGVSTPMSGTSPTDNPGNTRRGVAIRVNILDSNKLALKQQSLVRVTNQGTGRVLFQTTKGTEAIFGDLAPGKYLIEVGAAGYIAAHQEVNIPDLGHDVSENFLLTRDPAAVNLSLGDEPGLRGKPRKLAEKGAVALQLGNFSEARKYLKITNHDCLASFTTSMGILLTPWKQKLPWWHAARIRFPLARCWQVRI